MGGELTAPVSYTIPGSGLQLELEAAKEGLPRCVLAYRSPFPQRARACTRWKVRLAMTV